jgi:hypothetical protein
MPPRKPQRFGDKSALALSFGAMPEQRENLLILLHLSTVE